MLFHRYKAKFSSKGYKSYKYNYLRYWFLIGLVALIPISNGGGLFYDVLPFWFIQMLVIYLATENRIFRMIIPWMLLVVTIFFTSGAIYNKSAMTIGIAVWYFVAFIIALFTVGFNNRVQSTAQKNRLD